MSKHRIHSRNLPPRADSDHFVFDPATPHGFGPMEVPRYDCLYICRCWLLYCPGAVQLPPGNHAPSLVSSQVARVQFNRDDCASI